MKTMQWMWIGALFAVGCGSQQEAPAIVVAPTAAESSPPVASGAPAPSAPVATASAAAPAPTVAPSEPKLTEEERFWSELGNVINREVKACATGWTGDGEVTIKDDRIVKVTVDGQMVRSLTGKKTPLVPAQLKKRLERPLSISVCVGGPKIAHD